ncbi:hypothetical protein FRC17_001743, partial [Serendipita sp. 399]
MAQASGPVGDRAFAAPTYPPPAPAYPPPDQWSTISPVGTPHKEIPSEYQQYAPSVSPNYAKVPTEEPSTHGAPPGKLPKTWVPRVLRPPFFILVIVFMLALAIIVEVLLMASNKQRGFHFDGIEQPGAANLLRSFLPVLIITPIAQYWTRSNEEVLRLHPYVLASQGNAPPETTVLLDYSGLGRFRSTFKAIRLRHGVIVLSTVISLVTLLFQPLTAALFIIRPTEFEFWGMANTMSALGLRPDFNDLNAFAAAAGYTQAAALHGLGDPPFVWEGFSMPTVNVSAIYSNLIKNGTVYLNSVATQTDPRCFQATVPPPVRNGNGSFTLTGQYQGCSASVESDPNDREHFGVILVDNCAVNGTVPADPFKPIMFWFFSPSIPAASMVFCSPTVSIWNVVANISIVDNVLRNIHILERWDGISNVTSGAPLNGLALNGMFFGTPADEFVAARNTVIRSCLPGSIFRLADQALGIDNAIRQGLLEWTVNRYKQYLAMSAQSNYFLQTGAEQPARFVTTQLRLWLDPYTAHTFAAAFIITSVVAIGFYISHTRSRKNLYLAGPVGTIASTISLTNRSKFGDHLTAFDTEEDMAKKLEGL